jgi:hypothetical protein
MHPELPEKKGENVCGMDLTEPVASKEEPAAEDTTVVVATPLSTSSFSVDEILNNYLNLKCTNQRRLKGGKVRAQNVKGGQD